MKAAESRSFLAARDSAWRSPAMVFEPHLMLMAEPLSALDKQLLETVQIELRKLHHKLGASSM
jgi:ABC-type Fe3+/spermidine/putrescine transport system ATPase subunit